MSKNNRVREEPLKLAFPDEVRLVMQGAIDLHCHAGPSLIPRRIDIVQAAKQAVQAGLSALLVKDHHLPTARDVYYVKKYILGTNTQLDLMGGIALNHSVGGLNPYAVETALFFGARIVYLPTVSSQSHAEHHRKEVAGAHFPAAEKKLLDAEPIQLLDAHGRLPSSLTLIMEQVRDADVILSMGHLNAREILAILSLAEEIGLRRLIVHHPTFIIEAEDSEIAEFARRGAKIEFSACMSDPRSKFYFMPPEELHRMVRLIGINSVFVGSDLGQHDTPPFVEGMMVVADSLLKMGMTIEEVGMLFRVNPSKLLY